MATDWLVKIKQGTLTQEAVRIYIPTVFPLVQEWCPFDKIKHNLGCSTNKWEETIRNKLLWKKGRLRRALDRLKMPLDPNLGLIVVSGEARQVDFRAVVVESQMTFGANGFTVEYYDDTTWDIVVKVEETVLTRKFCWEYKGLGKARTGTPYYFNLELFQDFSVEEDITPDWMIENALGKQPAKQIRKSGSRPTYTYHLYYLHSVKLPLPEMSESEAVSKGQQLLLSGFSGLSFRCLQTDPKTGKSWPDYNVPYPKVVTQAMLASGSTLVADLANRGFKL